MASFSSLENVSNLLHDCHDAETEGNEIYYAAIYRISYKNICDIVALMILFEKALA